MKGMLTFYIFYDMFFKQKWENIRFLCFRKMKWNDFENKIGGKQT